MNMQIPTIKKSSIPWILGAVGVGYLAYRYLTAVKYYLEEGDVEARLPIAKDLKTIPDDQGNYDIDGVSFDTEGTVVSGDNNKGVSATI